MTNDYVVPAHLVNGFNCPQCGAFAHQKWYRYVEAIENPDNSGETRHLGPRFSVSFCERCRKFAIWEADDMFFPPTNVAPVAVADMPEEVNKDFEEARSIYSKSPRGAAALLRLAVQKLVIDLGEAGSNLNTDIGNLVKKGLQNQIQQALDTVRVIGNNAVHPGRIDIEDNPKIAYNLFQLVNIIIEQMITQPKKVKELFESLPKGTIEQISKRDEPE